MSAFTMRISIRGDLKKGAITYVKARRPLIPLTEPAAGA